VGGGTVGLDGRAVEIGVATGVHPIKLIRANRTNINTKIAFFMMFCLLKATKLCINYVMENPANTPRSSLKCDIHVSIVGIDSVWQ
jgi:hypothetical protein